MLIKRVTLAACLIIVCVVFAGCVKSKYNTRSFMTEEELAEIEEVYAEVEADEEVMEEVEIEPFLDTVSEGPVMNVNGLPVSKRDVVMLYEYLALDSEQDTSFIKRRACMEMIRIYAAMSQWPETINPTRERLTELRDQARGGADFGNIIRQNSMEPGAAETGGEMIAVPKNRFALPFEVRAFTSEIGDFIGPFPTEFGWHVLEVMDRDEDSPVQTVDVRHVLLIHGLDEQNTSEIRQKIDMWWNAAQVEILAPELGALLPEYARPAAPAATE